MRLRPILPGATLGLVSPASPIDAAVLQAGVAAVEALGYRTKAMPNVLARHHHLAGTDEQRASDLHQAFSDLEVDAVLCTRGGYGCARLLSTLDFDLIGRSGKPLLGFSDITTLHLALNRRGIPTLHSPMVATFARERPSWVADAWLRALAGDYLPPNEAPKGSCGVSGKAKGTTVGGCLTLLADSLGTPEPFTGQGSIVLLEDVGEKPYRVDAMLTHLLNAGAFQGVAGFVVGEVTEADEKRDSDDADWRTVMRDRLTPLGVPMIFDYPFGHIEAMLTLPLGLTAELDASAGELRFI